MGNFIDLAGQRFGNLTVIERSGSRNREALWHCKCDCGKETLSRSASLRGGTSKSCGCSRLVHLVEQPPRKTHGGSRKERLYYVWHGMIDRCNYPSHNRYHVYGGRGIQVCDEWKNDYSAFRNWALANGYDPDAKRGECTIDRIDVNGNYEPSNCRWVDMKTQIQNKQKAGEF